MHLYFDDIFMKLLLLFKNKKNEEIPCENADAHKQWKPSFRKTFNQLCKSLFLSVWMRFVIGGMEKLLYFHILNDIFGFRLGRGPLPSANSLCTDKAVKLQNIRKVKKNNIKSISRDKFCRKHVLN
jgi:hypothetical protein